MKDKSRMTSLDSLNTSLTGLVTRGLFAISLLALTGCGGSNELSTASTASKASFSMQQAFGDSIGPAETTKRRVVIKQPTMSDLAKAGPLGDRYLGNPNAKVTVIEYASLTCPHCRLFHEKVYPTFKREYIDTGKIKYVLREFPIGRSSGNAWIANRCGKGAKFFQLYDLYMKHQAEWVSQEVRLDKIYTVAAKSGMSRSQFDTCMKDEKLINHIKWVKDRGRTLNVIGTPTFYINTKQIRAVKTIDEMRAVIDPLLAGARVATSQ